MTFYTYQARDRSGALYEKTAEVKSKLDVYSLIREEGGKPVSIHESRSASLEKYVSGMFNGVGTHDKIIFSKNLASMIKAGLPVTRALSVMERQSRKKSLKKLFAGLSEDVSKGETLSDAVEKRPKIFPPLFVAMVRAGEESGNVAESLEIVSSQMDKTYTLSRKVRGALIYPAVIISVMIVLAIVMLIYMVPTLTATFEGLEVELPLSTRVIIFMSEFMVAHTLPVITSILTLVAGTLAFIRSTVGKRVFDVVSIRLPVIGMIVREVQSARTARTLSSLLSSGVNVVSALSVTTDVVQNHLYKKVLSRARTAMEKGEPMSAVFSEYPNLYPVFVGEMVSVGEETGKIADMLHEVAVFYEDEVTQKTKDLSTIIEPILMIIIGAGVGLFAISMLAPTYSLVDYI